MRVIVIGATGHVGSYLVPRLVRAGHEVVAITRGPSAPYHPDPAWEAVERIHLDRDAGDADGTFASRVADLGADAVIDMVCFTPESARQLVEALRGRVGLLLSCGTIWIHGPATEVPTAEEEAREPFGDYGVGKDAIERLLLEEARTPGGLRTAVLHPGHITGPGWNMIGPAGNVDLDVYRRLAAGEEVARFAELVGAENARTTWEHIARSPSSSIEKARRLLGYAPRYTSLEAVAEALQWLIDDGAVDTGGRSVREAALTSAD
jgi:nucleoside-diphosphate-sugar epimerase